MAETSPYVTRDRADWAELAATTPMTLDQQTIDRLRGMGDPSDLNEVIEVYLPLTRLLYQHYLHAGELYKFVNGFLNSTVRRTPYVIGIAGSVAVGKSTVARLLRQLLANWPDSPRVELVTTDGFLYPNAELIRRGILNRKGFPESYNRRALQRFVVDVKSGRERVTAPVYSHLIYDILPGEQIVVESPDVLIVEGLNVLQPARFNSEGFTGLALSDFFDFSVYVDALPHTIRRWYLQRFMQLRETAFRDPRSYFTRFAQLNEEDALKHAENIWDTINGPNLALNIRPTRQRASVILRKDDDHTVSKVRIRKI